MNKISSSERDNQQKLQEMINDLQNLKIDGAPEITQYEISLATQCTKNILSTIE